MDMGDYYKWATLPGIAGQGMSALFGGGSNPYKAGEKYYEQIPSTMEKYFNPYIEAGNKALPGLQEQYGQLINDPGKRMNEIGSSYQQSPGFQFAMQQALQGAGNAAAAGGMAGSPMHEQQNMELATNLANQDYNNYLQNALGMYGMGISGQQGLYDTGAHAGMTMGEDLASYLAQRGNMAMMGEMAKNQQKSGIWNAAGSAAGAIPFLF